MGHSQVCNQSGELGGHWAGGPKVFCVFSAYCGYVRAQSIVPLADTSKGQASRGSETCVRPLCFPRTSLGTVDSAAGINSGPRSAACQWPGGPILPEAFQVDRDLMSLPVPPTPSGHGVQMVPASRNEPEATGTFLAPGARAPSSGKPQMMSAALSPAHYGFDPQGGVGYWCRSTPHTPVPYRGKRAPLHHDLQGRIPPQTQRRNPVCQGSIGDSQPTCCGLQHWSSSRQLAG